MLTIRTVVDDSNLRCTSYAVGERFLTYAVTEWFHSPPGKKFQGDQLLFTSTVNCKYPQYLWLFKTATCVAGFCHAFLMKLAFGYFFLFYKERKAHFSPY